MTHGFDIWVAVGFGFPGHLLSPGEGGHAGGDGCLDDGLEIVLGMSKTELPRVIMY